MDLFILEIIYPLPCTLYSLQSSSSPLSGCEARMKISFYPLYFARFPDLLFYIEFANPIEFGNEISADQKSIILKLAEHIFGRFWIKYINLIVFTATQYTKLLLLKMLEHESPPILYRVMFTESTLRMMNQLRRVSSILLQPRLMEKLSGDKSCFVGI